MFRVNGKEMVALTKFVVTLSFGAVYENFAV
jgi:hypothetical protein